MRPARLNALFAPLTSLDGVGPAQAKLFARLFGSAESPRVIDLLFHLPVGAIDRSAQPKLRDVRPGEVVTVAVHVDQHRPGGRRGAPYRVQVSDETGDAVLTFFRGEARYLEKLLPVGETRYVSGRAELFDGVLQFVHPDHIVDAAGLKRLPRIEPVYPLTAGLAAGRVRRAMQGALARLPALAEWQAAPQRFNWPDFATALRQVHQPAAMGDVEPGEKARVRLAYDELLAGQLSLALMRSHLRRPAGARHAGDGRLREAVIKSLPYSLTPSQQRSLAEIAHDMAEPVRMLRLLQGDVGSGKTVVALLAAAAAIETGAQAAFMAPMELLARQHAATIAPLAEAAGIRMAILTGREKGRARSEILARLEQGEIDLLVGTHALFQEDVAFRRLALVIVDEQHRFGVHQRLALTEKGDAADVLVLTATPIPRTLVLTYYGDMDVSELREKPAGRKPVDTRAVPLERIDEVTDAVGRAIAAGRQVFWVCPLVAETETTDLGAATARFEALTARFGAQIGLVHGQMRGPERDATMARFQRGELAVLVATTVIEVGVDVPNASVIVIEHAERFGLAQLHQLRGRVGRGSAESTCLLLYRAPLGATAHARLDFLRHCEDGFQIAEEDLRLRGEGDVLGTRQSGMPGYRLVEPEVHGRLLSLAREEALEALKRHPGLAAPAAEPLRTLLYLFDRDEATRLIGAG